MSKHTPGPWSYHHEPRAAMSAIGNDNVVVAGIPNTGGEEAQANARLIAAAPDLLAALECFVAKSCPPDLCQSGAHVMVLVHRVDMERAEAAIAKAKGGDK